MAKISLHANYITNYIILMETDHTITQVLRYWVITTWSQIQSQDRLQGICAGQIGTVACFYPSALVFPPMFLYVNHQCHSLQN